MNTNITLFNFDSKEVRTATGEDGSAWFCAKDVCRVLGYRNPKQAVQDNCKSEKGVAELLTPSSGGDQKTIFVNEPNLCRLIFGSRLPKAEDFQSARQEHFPSPSYRTNAMRSSTLSAKRAVC